MDGSIHDWLGSGQPMCLMVLVDDATGRTYARLFAAETTEAAMRRLRWWVGRHGVPLALYTDRDSVYHTNREPTPAEQPAGEEPLTVFGRSCRKLGIALVPAHSPQAKGRVERKNGVFQDRLVKELRLRGIDTPAGANELLDGRFLEELNRRFAKAPAREADYHRRVPEGLDPASVFAIEEERTVGNDWTVRYCNRLYQISGPSRALPPAAGRSRCSGDWTGRCVSSTAAER
jgi:hypothetical protein